MNRRFAKLALLPAALLVCTPLYAQADPGDPPPPATSVAKPLWQADRDYYVNNIASQVESPSFAGRAARRQGPGEGQDGRGRHVHGQ